MLYYSGFYFLASQFMDFVHLTEPIQNFTNTRLCWTYSIYEDASLSQGTTAHPVTLIQPI